MTLLQFLDRFPPHLCRLVARQSHGRRGLSARQIAARSGLSLATVSSLSVRRTWAGVKIETIDAFARGCGVDFFHLRRHVQFLKKGVWSHVKNSNREQRKMYRRLLKV